MGTRSYTTCVGPDVMRVVAIAACAACGGLAAPSDAGSDASSDAAPDAAPDATTSGVVSISAGARYTCAVLTDRRVACWGDNVFGAIDGVNADSVYASPVVVSGVPAATSVSATVAGFGYPQTCAVATSGSLFCWGSDFLGQIGNSAFTNGVVPPTSVLDDVAAVSCGNVFTCAVTHAGDVRCWGEASDGELGVGTSDAGPLLPLPSPQVVVGLSGATSVGTGELAACALANGAVYCWGGNIDGVIGDGTTTNRYVPTKVTGIQGATALAVGEEHACAVTAGVVACWGSDMRGQLGDGSNNTNATTPRVVQGLSNVVAVSAGFVHTCALTQAGAVYCWGANDWGMLGDGSFVEHDTPVLVAGLPPATAISAGTQHTCALLASGDVMCWGDDTFAELGDGVAGFADGGARYVPLPVKVVGLPP